MEYRRHGRGKGGCAENWALKQMVAGARPKDLAVSEAKKMLLSSLKVNGKDVCWAACSENVVINSVGGGIKNKRSPGGFNYPDGLHNSFGSLCYKACIQTAPFKHARYAKLSRAVQKKRGSQCGVVVNYFKKHNALIASKHQKVWDGYFSQGDSNKDGKLDVNEFSALAPRIKWKTITLLRYLDMTSLYSARKRPSRTMHSENKRTMHDFRKLFTRLGKQVCGRAFQRLGNKLSKADWANILMVSDYPWLSEMARESHAGWGVLYTASTKIVKEMRCINPLAMRQTRSHIFSGAEFRGMYKKGLQAAKGNMVSPKQGTSMEHLVRKQLGLMQCAQYNTKDKIEACAKNMKCKVYTCKHRKTKEMVRPPLMCRVYKKCIPRTAKVTHLGNYAMPLTTYRTLPLQPKNTLPIQMEGLQGSACANF
jgi:hypothetical protein